MRAMLAGLILSLRVSAGTATLEWDPVEHATGYKVYRATGTNTVFNLFTNTFGTKLTITNVTPEPWRFYVTATNGVPWQSTLEEGPPSNQVQINVRPKAVYITVFATP